MTWKRKILRLRPYFFGILSLILLLLILGGAIYFVSRFLQDSYRNALTLFSSKKQLLEQSLVLQQENLLLREQLLTLQEQALQTEQAGPNRNGIPAKVIGVALGSNRGTVFIDKGKQDGIQEQDWVLAGEKTLVGKVENVFDDFAIVKTVFDPSLKTTAAVLPDNLLGLFSFSQGNFIIDLLPQNSAPEINALAETSGQDGIFTRGFLLGRITNVENSEQYPLKKAILEPAFEFNSLLSVRVVKNILQNE